MARKKKNKNRLEDINLSSLKNRKMISFKCTEALWDDKKVKHIGKAGEEKQKNI